MEEKIRVARFSFIPYTFKIYSKNEFFSKPVKVIEDHEKIVFIHPDLDDDHYYSPSKCKKSDIYNFQINSDYLETGKYVIDTELSNEDELHVYFEDKIN